MYTHDHMINLLRLADFLETEIKDSQFDLGSFRKNKNGYGTDFKDFNDCGTIGCALGWSPFVFSSEITRDDYDAFFHTLDWERVSLKFFGLDGFNVHWADLFSYLQRFNHFNGEIRSKTRMGTVKRIRDFINYAYDVGLVLDE